MRIVLFLFCVEYVSVELRQQVRPAVIFDAQGGTNKRGAFE